MKKLLIVGIVSLFLSACGSEGADYPELPEDLVEQENFRVEEFDFDEELGAYVHFEDDYAYVYLDGARDWGFAEDSNYRAEIRQIQEEYVQDDSAWY